MSRWRRWGRPDVDTLDWDQPSPPIAGTCGACRSGQDEWCKPTCTAEDPHWPPALWVMKVLDD